MEQLEIFVRQLKQTASKVHGELRTPFSMIGVGVLIDSLRIVEDGEQPDDFDPRPGRLAQSLPVFQNSGPIHDAMKAVDGQFILRQDCLNDGAEVDEVRVLSHFFFTGRTGFTGNFCRCIFFWSCGNFVAGMRGVFR